MDAAVPGGKGAAYSRMGALVSSGIFGINISLMLPLLSLRMTDAGETPVTVSVLGICAASGGMIAPLFVTSLARMMGLTRLALASLAVVPVTIVLFKVTEGSIALWFALMVFNSVGIAVVFIISETMIISSSQMSSRGLALGIYASIYSFGAAIGPGLLAVTEIASWTPYAVGAMLPVFAGAIFLAIHMSADGSCFPAEAEPTGTRLRDVMPLMGLGIACAFAHGAMEIMVLNLLPVYATEIGYSDREAAMLLSLIGVGGVIFCPLIGWYAGTRRRLQRALWMLCAFLTLGMPVVQQVLAAQAVWAAYALMVLWGAALGSLYLVGLISVALRFSGLQLVAASALFSQAFAVGTLVSPPAAGLAMEFLYPPHGLFVVLALFGSLPLVAYCLSPKFRN